MNEAHELPVVRAPREIAGEGIPDLIVAAAPHVLGEAPGVILDLAGVDFVSSAGLGRLVELGMDLRDRGAVLALAAPSRAIERLFRMVGFDRVMPIFASVESARTDLGARQARTA
jgi:anti-anti-sigma factor